MFNVYLISSEINGQKLYKIGFTRREPEKRIKEFKTGNASDFQIVEVFKSKWGTKIETQIHKKLRMKKIEGEWFQLDEYDIQNFISECQKIHNNLEFISKNNTYYLDRGDF
jgi:hypothetical protein